MCRRGLWVSCFCGVHRWIILFQQTHKSRTQFSIQSFTLAVGPGLDETAWFPTTWKGSRKGCNFLALHHIGSRIGEERNSLSSTTQFLLLATLVISWHLMCLSLDLGCISSSAMSRKQGSLLLLSVTEISLVSWFVLENAKTVYRDSYRQSSWHTWGPDLPSTAHETNPTDFYAVDWGWALLNSQWSQWKYEGTQDLPGRLRNIR